MAFSTGCFTPVPHLTKEQPLQGRQTELVFRHKAQGGAAILTMGSVGHVANNRVLGFLHLVGDITQGLWLLSHALHRIMGKTYRIQGHLGHISSGVL